MRHGLKVKVGLALGGGAARGMAHLGVLRVFEREKIPIDVLAGTSMGAIIGGAYAASPEIAPLESKIREILSSESFQKNRLSFLKETKQARGGLFFSVANLVRRGIFFGVSNLRTSFLSAEEFASSMEAILPDEPIESLPMRFGAVCLDLTEAEQVILCSGNLRRAASASSAIPGILPPVKIGGRVLIDGGWAEKIPVLPAFSMGADVVIAVDIAAGVDESNGLKSGADIMVRANAIKDSTLCAYSCGMSDLTIRPAVSGIHWADFGAYDRCIEAGAEAAEEVVPKIKEILRHERVFSLVRPGAGRRLADLTLEATGLKLVII